MIPDFAPEDEGKAVCTADGIPLGRIARVRNGEAFVEPKEGLLEGYGSLLSTCWRCDRAYHLNSETVIKITDREIRLEISVRDLTAEVAP